MTLIPTLAPTAQILARLRELGPQFLQGLVKVLCQRLLFLTV